MDKPSKIRNPETGRMININGETYKRIVKKGLLPEFGTKSMSILGQNGTSDRNESEFVPKSNLLDSEKSLYIPDEWTKLQINKLGELACRVNQLPTDLMIMTMEYLEYDYVEALFRQLSLMESNKILCNNEHRLWKFLVCRDLTKDWPLFLKNVQKYNTTVIAEYTTYSRFVPKQFHSLWSMTNHGYEKGVQKLLLQGANANQRDVICRAAVKGNVKIVMMLLKAGNQYKKEALHRAIRRGNIKTTIAILQTKNVRVQNITIQKTIMNGNLDMLKVFLRFKINPSHPKFYNDNVRSHLLLHNREDVVSFMESISSL